MKELACTALLSTLTIPVVVDSYKGTATEYVVINQVDNRPDVYGDNEDIADVTIIRANYFIIGKPRYIKAIRRLLRAAGFTIASTQELYESETGYTHVIVEAAIEGVINDEED